MIYLGTREPEISSRKSLVITFFASIGGGRRQITGFLPKFKVNKKVPETPVPWFPSSPGSLVGKFHTRNLFDLEFFSVTPVILELYDDLLVHLAI